MPAPSKQVERAKVGQVYRGFGDLWTIVYVEPNGDVWVRPPGHKGGTSIFTLAAWLSEWELVSDAD